jgi:hypothetical protein
MRMLPLCWMRPTGLPRIIAASPGDMSSFLVQGPSFSISSSSTPGIQTTGILKARDLGTLSQCCEFKMIYSGFASLKKLFTLTAARLSKSSAGIIVSRWDLVQKTK